MLENMPITQNVEEKLTENAFSALVTGGLADNLNKTSTCLPNNDCIKSNSR